MRPAELLLRRVRFHHRHGNLLPLNLLFRLLCHPQELLIDTSPWCLPLHTALTLHEIIVDILAGGNNARHPEGGTEDGIEDLDEEGVQDGDGIAPSSKAVLIVSQK